MMVTAHTKKDLSSEKRSLYPEFMKIVDLISRHNPLQSKRIYSFVMAQDKEYWAFCEDISKNLNQNLFLGEARQAQAVEAYNDLCMQMLRDQIQFRKSKKYPKNDALLARQEVYDDPAVMHKYMIGLLLTQMLWSNHYALFQFFKSYLQAASPRNYLEVGAGHGLFMMEAKRLFPNLSATICDISQTSLDISKAILKTFEIDFSGVQFIHGDFLEFSSKEKQFDFITLGEVLEHVNDARGFMKRVHDLLLPEGRAYVSTCANCPAVDHVYHFRSVKEIRELLRDCNFSIENEIFLPAENVPEELWEGQLITINYAAILKPRKK